MVPAWNPVFEPPNTILEEVIIISASKYAPVAVVSVIKVSAWAELDSATSCWRAGLWVGLDWVSF